MPNIWITADQHYFHENIIKFQNRPFANVQEMNNQMVKLHNSVVDDNDIVYNVGDFSLGTYEETVNLIAKLNGNQVFLRGDHDYWMDDIKSPIVSKNFNEIVVSPNQLYELNFGGQSGTSIILCHYALRVWRKKHYGSYHFYGHSHGNVPNVERSMDVGVDTNKFRPYEYREAIAQINSRYEFVKEF